MTSGSSLPAAARISRGVLRSGITLLDRLYSLRVRFRRLEAARWSARGGRRPTANRSRRACYGRNRLHFHGGPSFPGAARARRQHGFEVVPVVTLQSVLMRILPLPRPGRCFADAEWRTLARAAEVMLPTAREVPPEDVADNVERFLVRGRSRRAWRVRVLMHLVEFLP